MEDVCSVRLDVDLILFTKDESFCEHKYQDVSKNNWLLISTSIAYYYFQTLELDSQMAYSLYEFVTLYVVTCPTHKITPFMQHTPWVFRSYRGKQVHHGKILVRTNNFMIHFMDGNETAVI